jgi:hypothetical protein
MLKLPDEKLITPDILFDRLFTINELILQAIILITACKKSINRSNSLPRFRRLFGFYQFLFPPGNPKDNLAEHEIFYIASQRHYSGILDH